MLRKWIGDAQVVAIAAPAWSEFLCGPVSADTIDLASALLGKPLPFGSAEATTSAALFNHAGRRRGSLIDCMIAACAIEAGARLATTNRRDFRRFESMGLGVLGPG